MKNLLVRASSLGAASLGTALVFLVILSLIACSSPAPSADVPEKKEQQGAVMQNVTKNISFAPGELPGKTIKIIYLLFLPNATSVPRGTTVTWINKDTFKGYHRVLSTTDVIDGQRKRKMFDSGNLKPGESYSFTFTETGNYPYIDPIFTKDKDFLGGVIVVT